MRKILASFLVLYFLALNAASGLVLCWGEDGHFAVESTLEASECCDPAKLEDKAQSKIKSGGVICEHTPCWDIQLAFQPESGIRETAAFNAATFVSASVPVRFFGYLASLSTCRANRVTGLSPSVYILPSLQTIQLLI